MQKDNCHCQSNPRESFDILLARPFTPHTVLACVLGTLKALFVRFYVSPRFI